MAKASIQDLQDYGWVASMFGNPVDWTTPTTGYLARVLVEIEAEVTEQVSPTIYSGATGATLARIKSGEIHLSNATLCRRRIVFRNSNANLGRSDSPRDTENMQPEGRMSECDRLERLGWHRLSKVSGIAQGSGMATSVVTTDRSP